MPTSKRTAFIQDAIRKALASLEVLPDGNEARVLREECRSWERAVKDWAHAPPTPEERERAMRKVLALHVSIAKLRR